MLDWFGGLIGYDASAIELGRVLRLDRAGAIVSERETWERAEGSFESGVQVTRDHPSLQMVRAARRHGLLCSDDVLRVSGNPSKFLQGHNLIGPSVAKLGPLVQAMVRRFPGELHPPDCECDVLPTVRRCRVDIAVMVDLGDHDTVHEWLYQAGSASRSRHKEYGGAAMMKGGVGDRDGTVYWGWKSTRWKLRAYCKWCEVRDHSPGLFGGGSESLPCVSPERACDGVGASHGSRGEGALVGAQSGRFGSAVEDWTRRMLRIELVLFTPEMVNRGTLDESLVWEYLSRVEFGVMKPMSKVSTELSARESDAFMTWVSGHDLRDGKRSRASFYRLRRVILDKVGVDIALPASEEVKKLEPARLERDLFDVKELASRVANRVPDELQRSLFDGGEAAHWGVR